MKKLLVAVDLSAVSQRVLQVARELALAANAETCLVHVAAPDPDFVGYAPGPQCRRDALAERFHEEHRQIQRMAEELNDAGVRATGLLLQGAAGEEILSEGARCDVDFIVVGSHGHGAMYHLLSGSVSEYVLRYSTVPVLVVPAKE